MAAQAARRPNDDALLRVEGLSVSYPGDHHFSSPGAQMIHAVRDLSFEIMAGETLGIVGESGSGKTQSALSVIGLLPETARRKGSAIFSGRDLLLLNEAKLNEIRGSAISMIFQDPMTSLNPHLTIGRQMARVLERHQGVSRQAALHAAAQMLDAVRVPDAAERLRQYPHEMSGGMRQRIMIATALLCKPQLLIADEPTTALDVTVQAQILTLMYELQQELGTAILLITHDMGVVAGSCNRVLVMRDGKMRECGSINKVFYESQDSYTRELLAAVPRLDEVQTRRLAVVGNAPAKGGAPDSRPSGDTMLMVANLDVRFDAGRPGVFKPKQYLQAVADVSFELKRGETLGIVGESGCGKSSLARGVLQLVDVHAGRVALLGEELGTLDRRRLKQKRRQMQVIFQDPLASLDPRMTVADIVSEPLHTFFPSMSRTRQLVKVKAILERVGLKAEHMNRYPHEFSGGQCQRIGIARALIAEPELIICDEPVSALDVSVQAQIVNLLMDLQQEMGLALIFIAHDLAVVKHISHRVMVMYLGRIAEVAERSDLYESPRHPYTQALISAVPIPDPKIERNRDRTLLQGDVPSPLEPPSGCAFRTRCPLADYRCAAEMPGLRTLGNSLVACHHA
ncbi:MAG: ABC transporter ATP-binding protein [Gammaproteobacteria bacterium]|jgi:oligopeptide/dipeptide ABC transporter ATP-binding protein|nr:ABC transporter ATP-binding protein [Gammaproteobacteria bacterium]MDP6616898.1 ABC transporter ATP-binding protein [Gammaproteobacteria bacterium]MDP6694542.1 ABC transporter ATP-binding protein [Gammaproteobacteria bacterium]MDP7041600.1 ABC transporter ATP-binding protein [Gammaproteobacteria bacterium]